jgi:endonuclease/exonuclease/phosphatase family metal-dependent hydrolase
VHFLRLLIIMLIVLTAGATLCLGCGGSSGDDDDDSDVVDDDDDDTTGDDDDDSAVDDDDDDDDDDNDDDDTSGPETVKAMTFNLRTGLALDGENAWSKRKEIVTNYIAAEMPDVMGVQEALVYQLSFIKQNVPGYAWVGRSRRLLPDEYSAVFYRTDKYTLIDQNTFWLSDTPEAVGSSFTSNQLCPRIVTWAELESIATGRTLFVFNTHFDTYHGEEVHERSAALMVDRIEQIAGNMPVLVTGDFNETVGSSGYQILTGEIEYLGSSGNLLDPWVALSLPEEGTFHGFTGVATGSSRIDWVLQTDHFTPTAGEVSHYNEADRYPSDHFPVYNEYTWPK